MVCVLHRKYDNSCDLHDLCIEMVSSVKRFQIVSGLILDWIQIGFQFVPWSLNESRLQTAQIKFNITKTMRHVKEQIDRQECYPAAKGTVETLKLDFILNDSTFECLIQGTLESALSHSILTSVNGQRTIHDRIPQQQGDLKIYCSTDASRFGARLRLSFFSTQQCSRMKQSRST